LWKIQLRVEIVGGNNIWAFIKRQRLFAAFAPKKRLVLPAFLCLSAVFHIILIYDITTWPLKIKLISKTFS